MYSYLHMYKKGRYIYIFLNHEAMSYNINKLKLKIRTSPSQLLHLILMFFISSVPDCLSCSFDLFTSNVSSLSVIFSGAPPFDQYRSIQVFLGAVRLSAPSALSPLFLPVHHRGWKKVISNPPGCPFFLPIFLMVTDQVAIFTHYLRPWRPVSIFR